MDTTTQEVRARTAIIRTLKQYPIISRTMLSLHVRPNHYNWDEALEQLIAEGIVIREPVIRETGRAAVIFKLADMDIDTEEVAHNIPDHSLEETEPLEVASTTQTQ